MDILFLFIGFIFAVFVALLYEYKIRQMQKESRNKVHFYVARDMNGGLYIYLGKPYRGEAEFCGSVDENIFVLSSNFKSFGLNEKDYEYLKWEDEPVEVFINIED